MDLVKDEPATDGPAPDDAARTRADAALQAAVGRGALGLAEYEHRAGQVWAAGSAAELDRLTADLPAAVAVPVAPSRVRDHTVAVLSESTSHGSADGALAATAVLGTAVLDLRRTDLPDQVDVRAVAVLGEVTVLVPRGVAVRTRGPALLGSRSVDVAPAEPGAPVVTVHGGSLLGSVHVHHGDTPAAVEERTGRRRGPWRAVVAVVVVVAAGYGVTQVVGADERSVFGSGTYSVPAGQSTVDVAVLFGSEKVVVPDGTSVVVTGGMVFGSTDCKAACNGTSPTVTVHASGAFGSVEVLTMTEERTSDQDG